MYEHEWSEKSQSQQPSSNLLIVGLHILLSAQLEVPPKITPDTLQETTSSKRRLVFLSRRLVFLSIGSYVSI